MRKRKSWREKLADSKGLPKVEQITGKSARWGAGTVVIPAPREVDEMMRQVPAGALALMAELRESLARRHGATICCPLTSGIFAWIAAHAAEEAAAEGDSAITPYWRTLKPGGEVNPKFPACAAERLEREGHRLFRRGQRVFVENFKSALHHFN